MIIAKSGHRGKIGPRYMKRLIACIVAVFAVTMGFAVPSQAGGNSTLPPGTITPLVGPCGSSYAHVGHITSGSTMALDVYYSSTAKRNCLVVNRAGSAYGVAGRTMARIRPAGFSWPACNSTGCDIGTYAFYAGPVYTPSGVDMSNRCINIWGEVTYAGNTQIEITGNIHCG